MLEHLILKFFLQSLLFGLDLLVDDLLHIFPLCLQLLLNFDDLLVSVPHCLARAFLKQGVASAIHFDTSDNIRHFTLVNFCLVTTYLVKLVP